MNVVGLVISVACFPDAAKCILKLLLPSPSGRWADAWCSLRGWAGCPGCSGEKPMMEHSPMVLPWEGPCAALEAAAAW